MERNRQKTDESGYGLFNRTAIEVNSNNNTDKENIQNKQRNAQSHSHCPVPCTLPSHDWLPAAQLPHRKPA